MWSDLLISSKIMNNKFVKDIHNESIEIIKTLSGMRKKPVKKVKIMPIIQPAPISVNMSQSHSI